METLKTGDAPSLVTNIEMMRILSRKIDARGDGEESDITTHATRRGQKENVELQHLDWMEEVVYEYIQSTPCASVDFGHMPELVAKLKGGNVLVNGGSANIGNGKPGHTDGASTSGNDHSGGDGNEGFGLTDGETLQILNLMPRETVEIHLLIEDLPSRMTEERQSELLETVGKYSASPDEYDEGNMVEENEAYDEDIAVTGEREQNDLNTIHSHEDNEGGTENGYR